MRDYPILPGLTFSVTWRPIWSGETQSHQSGAEYRVSYWQEPLWEWDLSYDVLRDGRRDNYGNWEEMRQLVGLFNASCGTTFGFRFYNPDDNRVSRQLIGTTDGSSTLYDIVRTYGANNLALGVNSTEHVGFLDLSKWFALYIDLSIAPEDVTDPTYGYTVLTSTPGLQQIKFNSAPPAGHKIYLDMSYLYYARFRDNSQDFEKFMASLWALKRVTLRSLRSENAS